MSDTLVHSSRRIIVTGSRDWRNAAMIRNALVSAIEGHHGPVVVVQGGADGADELAATLAATLGPHVTAETWDADWGGPCRPTCRPRHRRRRRSTGEDYCPAAGNYRNDGMVKAGAYLCLGFPLGDCDEFSYGTRDCMRRAKAAGIPVINVPSAACAPLFLGRATAARRAWAIADRASVKPVPPVWCQACDGWHLAPAALPIAS